MANTGLCTMGNLKPSVTLIHNRVDNVVYTRGLVQTLGLIKYYE